jgi:hypothetical protein
MGREVQVEGDVREVLTGLMAPDDGLAHRHGEGAGHGTFGP